MRRLKRVLPLIQRAEHRLNWKTVLLLYLITRIGLVIMLSSSWQGESLLCYTADCKSHWHNVNFVVEGKNPYIEWRKAGGYGLPIPLKAEHPPFLYLLMSTFVWLWKSVWSMRLIFFLFDFLNVYLIYKLTKFKNISSLLYIFAPSILRGLLFVEEELFVTFALASVYFFNKRNYSLSTIMLALIFNIKIFPIVLFPILLYLILKETKNFSTLIKQILIFTLTTAICHLFFFPDWYMAYESRALHYTLLGNFGVWNFLSTAYYLPLMLTAFILFYIFTYIKNLDIKTGYLLGSLIFISLYPRFSFDHFIFLIPLFLVWSRLNLSDIIFWIFLSIGVVIEFLGLPSIGIITSFQREIMGVLILIGFYLIIANHLKNKFRLSNKSH